MQQGTCTQLKNHTEQVDGCVSFKSHVNFLKYFSQQPKPIRAVIATCAEGGTCKSRFNLCDYSGRRVK